MQKSVKECLISNENEEVVVIGILCNPMDGITKAGKPYADFDLYANGSTVSIKVWDMCCQEFLDVKGVELGKPVTIHGVISVNPLNGVKQICVRDGEIPSASSYSVPGEAVEDIIEKLVQSTPIPVTKMIDTIRSLFNSYFPAEAEGAGEGFRGNLRDLCTWALDEILTGNVLSYPYGPDVHKERSGLVAHIYNCCHQLAFMAGVPDFDKGVVLTALLTYHLGSTFIYSVDSNTGLITETNSLEEYGSLGNFCSQFVISWSGKLTQVLGEIDPSIRNYMACVNALNGLCEPVSIESQIARSIATNELECFRIYEAVNGHSYTDHCFIKKEGRSYTVYNFTDK